MPLSQIEAEGILRSAGVDLQAPQAPATKPEKPRGLTKAEADELLDQFMPQIPDDRRKQLDQWADYVVQAGDLDRGDAAANVSAAVKPEERMYFLRKMIDRQSASKQNEDRSYLGRVGRGAVRGFVGVKEGLDKTLQAITGSDQRTPDQRQFGDTISNLREQADPLIPPDMMTPAKWPIQAAEMAAPQAVSALAAPGRVAATAFWTTQIFPAELQQMRDAGMKDTYAYPAAAISSVAQAAVETLNLSPLLPQQAIKPVVMYSLSKAAKDYGKELSEEGIQAAISETFQALGAAADEQVPGKGVGQALQNVANQMIEAAGPLAVMMGFGAGAARYRTRNAPREGDLKQQQAPAVEVPLEVDPSIDPRTSGPIEGMAGPMPKPDPTAESIVNDLIRTQETPGETPTGQTPEEAPQPRRWAGDILLTADGAKEWADAHPEAVDAIRAKIAAGQPITRSDVPDVDPANPLNAEGRTALGKLLSGDQGKQPTPATPELPGPSVDQPEEQPKPEESKPLPEWAKEQIDRDYSLAERLGIVDTIAKLSSQGKTAQQIVSDLNVPGQDRAESSRIVRSVRSRLGIPSMDDAEEFAAWKAKYDAANPLPAPEPPATPVVDQPRETTPVVDQNQPSGETQPPAKKKPTRKPKPPTASEQTSQAQDEFAKQAAEEKAQGPGTEQRTSERTQMLLDERQRILEEGWQAVQDTGLDDFASRPARKEWEDRIAAIDRDLKARGNRTDRLPTPEQYLQTKIMQRDLRSEATSKRGTTVTFGDDVEEQTEEQPQPTSSEVVATETRPEGQYEYRVAPHTLESGKRGFRLEMRKSGATEWESALAGHHSTRLAAMKSIGRVAGLGEVDAKDQKLRDHLSKEKAKRESEQAKKAREQEEARREEERDAEFHARMTDESKLNKWERGEYDIFVPKGANKTVKGYKWKEWGLSKLDKKSTTWVLTHVPTGLQAGIGVTLDEAKAIANALSKLGDWSFSDSKKIPMDQMGKASLLVKAWRRRGAPDYDKVPELAPPGYQPKAQQAPAPKKKRPTRKPKGSSGTAAFMANPEAEEAEAKAPNSGFATDFDHRETTTPPRPGPQPEPAEPNAPHQERPVKGIPMPELVKLAKWIQGHPPLVRRLGKALGLFKGTVNGVDIFIDPRVATDPNVMAQVLAHEMGHLIDFLPHRTLRRGNILGRIASLKDYMKNFLAGYPGGPGPLTDAERKRLKKEAERLSKSTAEEEVDEVIRTETPITPKDILNIWNSVEGDINPELLDYVKKLSAADKKSIVKAALKNIVPERLKRFAKVVEAKTGRKIKRKVPVDAKTVHKKYRELIEEELKKRQIIEHEAIREELISLSHWWTPYNRQANAGQGGMYRQYRESSAELYAQALSVMLVAPKSLQERAPQFWQAFWAYADRKRDVLKAYLDIQDMLFGLPERLQEIRRGDVREGFAHAEEAVVSRMEEADARRRSILTDFGMGLFDQAMPILSDAKSKPTSARAEAAIYALNELTMRDSPIKGWLDEVQDGVVEPIVAKGMNIDHLGQYLAFRRMATERAEVANPYGHTVETSEEALADLKRELGDENWKALEDAIKRFDDLIFRVVEDAVAAGVYNRQTFETTLRPNKGQYATFAVVDHLDKEMPAEIRHQVGTFDEIGNPFSFTTAKMVAVQRAIELNRAKTAVRDFYNTDFPGSLERKQVAPGQQPGRARPGNDHLLVMENGRPAFYETDAYIPAVFKHPDVNGLTRVAKLIGSTQYKVFHPLYVTLSPGWQIFNLPRDFKRTYKNLETGRKGGENELVAALRDLKRLGGAYYRAFGPAWRRASGRFDPLIADMEKNRELDTALASFDWTDDSNVYERLLTRYGVMQDTAKREEANVLRRGLSSLFSFIERVGVTTETVSKVAARRIFDQNGIDPRKRSYLLRNYVGTPNYHIKGTGTQVTNSLLMYSNVILQGWRADVRVATDPNTAAGYWLRSLLVDFMPKAAMIGAASGLFGASVAAWMAMIPDYDKSKYIIIPLGTTTDPKTGETRARYARMPHDDVNRLICGLAWEMSKAKDASLSRLASEVYGEIPSASPGITIGLNWVQFLRGSNPKDWFRDREILSRDAFEVGGWYATKEMFQWTFNQFGVVSTLAHGAIGYPGSERETFTQRVIGSIPGIDRLVKTSNRGLTEDAWGEVDVESAEKARLRLSLDDTTRSLVKTRYRLNRLGDERLPLQDARRRAVLNAWYGEAYLDLTQILAHAEKKGDKKVADRARSELRSRSERIQKLMVEKPEVVAQVADRMRAMDAIQDLASGRPAKTADVPAWEEKRAKARDQLVRMGLGEDQVMQLWSERNREQLKTASGRREAMERLRKALRTR